MEKIMEYVIRDKWEETVCAVCGYPLYIGDFAYSAGESEEVVCSRKCAKEVENKK